MKDEIRIRLSVGLIVVAVLHAVLLGAVFTALHAKPKSPNQDSSWNVPPARPSSPEIGAIEKLEQPQRVNLQAQGELKQQSPQRCLPRPINTSQKPPTTTSTTIAAPKPQTPAKKYQIALFIGSDAKSKQLLDWFNHDSKLYKLRTESEFQVYTTGNALYKTRFANIVPAEQFPVALFQDSTGGHVHAAGRAMLPSTAAELYADFQRGYELYLQTRQAQKTGALKSRGYSWDAAITPTMQLNPEDCPDGYCPIEPTDSWRPMDRDRDRVRDLLLDRSDNHRTAFLWASAGELATIALIVLAVILLGFILIKRGM